MADCGDSENRQVGIVHIPKVLAHCGKLQFDETKLILKFVWPAKINIKMA